MLERADKTQAYKILRTQESKIIDRYRVTDGETFRPKDYDPADTAGHQSDKPLARELLEGGVQRLGSTGETIRPGSLGDAVLLPGDGRRRQRQHHQTRDVGREPARRAGNIVQGTGS
jgi:hypothetical protein